MGRSGGIQPGSPRSESALLTTTPNWLSRSHVVIHRQVAVHASNIAAHWSAAPHTSGAAASVLTVSMSPSPVCGWNCQSQQDGRHGGRGCGSVVRASTLGADGPRVQSPAPPFLKGSGSRLCERPLPGTLEKAGSEGSFACSRKVHGGSLGEDEGRSGGDGGQYCIGWLRGRWESQTPSGSQKHKKDKVPKVVLEAPKD